MPVRGALKFPESANKREFAPLFIRRSGRLRIIMDAALDKTGLTPS